MAKKKHRKKNSKKGRRLPEEDARTEAMTVAWMLSTMVTCGALGIAGLVVLAMRLSGADPAALGTMRVIPSLLLAIATVTGTVSLILMGCTLAYRKYPPPRPVVIFSTATCCLPFIVHLALAVGQSS